MFTRCPARALDGFHRQHREPEALRRTGDEINARFLAAAGEGAPPPPDADTLTDVVLPSEHDGLRAPGLRFGDPRVMALLDSLACFAHVIAGLTNAGLRDLITALRGRPYTNRHASYDLRRLRRKGFTERVPGHHRYRVTPHGRVPALPTRTRCAHRCRQHRSLKLDPVVAKTRTKWGYDG